MLVRSQVNSHPQYSINPLISIQLKIKSPLLQRRKAGLRLFSMLGRLQHVKGWVGPLPHENAHFHPVIDGFAIQNRPHGGQSVNFSTRPSFWPLLSFRPWTRWFPGLVGPHRQYGPCVEWLDQFDSPLDSSAVDPHWHASRFLIWNIGKETSRTRTKNHCIYKCIANTDPFHQE